MNRKQTENPTSRRRNEGSGRGSGCSLDGAGGLQIKRNKRFWAAEIVHYNHEFPEEISLSAGGVSTALPRGG